jgi:hypothetical protein
VFTIGVSFIVVATIVSSRVSSSTVLALVLFVAWAHATVTFVRIRAVACLRAFASGIEATERNLLSACCLHHAAENVAGSWALVRVAASAAFAQRLKRRNLSPGANGLAQLCELVAHDAKTVHVSGSSVVVPVVNLRRSVLWGPDAGSHGAMAVTAAAGKGAREVAGEAKISKFGGAEIGGEEYVAGFDVAVDNALSVHGGEGAGDIADSAENVDLASDIFVAEAVGQEFHHD